VVFIPGRAVALPGIFVSTVPREEQVIGWRLFVTDTAWISIVRYTVGSGGDRNVPVSVDEGSSEEWALLQDNGVVHRGFATKEDALESWKRLDMPPDVHAYVVKVCTRVSQEGRL